MTLFLQQMLNGLTLGSIYALLAIGFALIFGVLNLVTFAHGEVLMVGAVGAFLVMELFPHNLALGLVVSFVVAFIVGLIVERISFRPFKGAPHMTTMLSTVGISIILMNLAIIFWSAETESLPYRISYGFFQIGEFRITGVQILIMIISAFLLVALTLFLDRTKWGRAMRAISLDVDMARLLGVPSPNIMGLAFALGSALAGVAGILIGIYYNAFSPYMGQDAGLKAFAATVLGGFGSILGAVLGGVILGIAESLTVGYISPAWRDVVAFVILVTVLLLRPRGLMGTRSL